MHGTKQPIFFMGELGPLLDTQENACAAARVNSTMADTVELVAMTRARLRSSSSHVASQPLA